MTTQPTGIGHGYVHCSHRHCFTIIIGRPGDLCDDCRADPETDPCEGCDNDLVDQEDEG